MNQITGLIDLGHEVEIYADQTSHTSKVHPDVEKYKLLDRTYYSQRPSKPLYRLLKGIRLLLTNFHKAPLVLLVSLNFFKYGRYALTGRIFYSAILFLDKNPYDIIQCHFGYFGLWGMALKEIGAVNGKLVTSFHGADLTAHIEENGERCYGNLFKRGDLFLPVSDCFKSRLIELECPKEKIVVHHTGIDCNKFKFIPRREVADRDRICLVTICRLVDKKGVEYGIRAVAKLAKLNHKLSYKIIGDGPLKADLQLLIEELDVADNVKLLGWQQQDEILKILNNSEILLAPSVTSKNGDREGIPVAIMEAMAMGLLIISTQHSGIPELVQDGVSGFLVPERDVDSLADRIKYLIEHQEIWPQMSHAARLVVEEQYNIDKLNNRLVEIYQKVINEDK